MAPDASNLDISAETNSAWHDADYDWEKLIYRETNKWQTVTLTQRIKQPLTSLNTSPEGNILA